MAVAFAVPQALGVWLLGDEWTPLRVVTPIAILLGLASLTLNGTRWARAGLVIWLCYFILRLGIGTLLAMAMSPAFGMVMLVLAAGAAYGAYLLWFSKDVEALLSAGGPNGTTRPRE